MASTPSLALTTRRLGERSDQEQLTRHEGLNPTHLSPTANAPHARVIGVSAKKGLPWYAAVPALQAMHGLSTILCHKG